METPEPLRCVGVLAAAVDVGSLSGHTMDVTSMWMDVVGAIVECVRLSGAACQSCGVTSSFCLHKKTINQVGKWQLAM